MLQLDCDYLPELNSTDSLSDYWSIDYKWILVRTFNLIKNFLSLFRVNNALPALPREDSRLSS